jgi:hypothetical protein
MTKTKPLLVGMIGQQWLMLVDVRFVSFVLWSQAVLADRPK